MKTAQAYLDSGLYFWNSGMFLFKTETVLENFRHHAQDTLEIVQNIMKDNASNLQNIPVEDYARIPSQPFDIAIMEKAERIAVVTGTPDVSDIGSWTGLWNILDKDKNGNSITGRVRLQDSHDCLIQAHSRLVACAGLKDMVVIETPDSVLITTKAQSDSIKTLIAGLKTTDLTEVTESTSGSRPWGSFKILSRAPDYEIREIIINPSHAQPARRMWGSAGISSGLTGHSHHGKGEGLIVVNIVLRQHQQGLIIAVALVDGNLHQVLEMIRTGCLGHATK